MDRLNKIIDDLTEIKITLATNTIVLEKNAEDVAVHIKRTGLLEQQMRTALIPIQFAKWSVAIAAALATFLGVVHLTLQVLGLR